MTVAFVGWYAYCNAYTYIYWSFHELERGG